MRPFPTHGKVLMTPEEQARQQIDRLLSQAGWTVQSMGELNLHASLGVAVREFHLTTGFADYMLFVDGKAAGVIEAKAVGATLSGVAGQAQNYAEGLPPAIPHVGSPLPFVYESTGVETFFRDLRDPQPASRRVFAFHQPTTLHEWSRQNGTLRRRLSGMPEIHTGGLRVCQIEAIEGLEESLAAARPRALIQAATGSGKTYTAATASYRLIKHASAKRVLFLVDRNNLGRQTKREFADYRTPDDGRRFTDLYNVQHLTSNVLDPVNKVCITTIQRLFSMHTGQPEPDEGIEERSAYEMWLPDDAEKTVVYSPDIPIETFDFIVTDECHRSIYNLWRQVLEYFDAFLIGLTATPSKQTLGFFGQNLVTEYTHERAVADGVNVPFEVYRIKTEITEQGGSVDAGYNVGRRDKRTRKMRYEQLDEAMDYAGTQLDRSVVAVDQIRTVIRTFRERLHTDLFPGRTETPKTLIFAKTDSHAEDIVGIVREEFGKGNDFCKKITYRTTGETPERLLASFRNSYNPRIAVTVDMISTGTDIKPLECLLFMRDVKSAVYFEQMKGRGVRSINDADLVAVTPDAKQKDRFVIVDAVGVTEHEMSTSEPIERKRSVPFEKLLETVALGIRDEDTLRSLAGRLARLEPKLEPRDVEKIAEDGDGAKLNDLTHALLNAVDPDAQQERAKADTGATAPTDAQLADAAKKLADEACAPLNSPALRQRLTDIKTRNDQTIDDVSKDIVLQAGFDQAATERARGTIETFKQFIEENRDELTALQIIYEQPHGRRKLTYDEVKSLAEALERPPHRLLPDAVWKAYEQLERSKVKRARPETLLTDIVSLVRFATGAAEELEPYSEVVGRRFDIWMEAQAEAGRGFTAEQVEWLEMIRNHVAASVTVEADDFEYAPFHGRGGIVKAHQVFGADLAGILGELNEALVV
jgi:type I restriction enzyme, R subunit